MNSFDCVCDMGEKSYLYVLMQGECLIIQSQKQYEEMQQVHRQINEAAERERLLKERQMKVRQRMREINGQ